MMFYKIFLNIYISLMQCFTRKYLFLFYVFISVAIVAQDTNYVKSNDYWGYLRASEGALTQQINLYSTNVAGRDAQNKFIPTVNSPLRLGLSLKFFTLSYSFKTPFNYYDSASFGNTSYKNIAFDSYSKRVGIEAFYNSYEGFFKAKKFHEAYNVRPDISLTHWGGNLLFFFNVKKFCYRAAFGYSKRQIKSAGGFVLLTSFSYKKIGADSSLIYKEIDSTSFFGIYRGLRVVRFALAELRPGYAYCFVLKGGKYFICPYFSTGVGGTLYNITSDFNTNNVIALHWDINFRLAAGYNNKRLFGGVSVEANKNANYLRSATVLSHTSFSLNITGGIRFGKKKSRKKN